MWIKYILLFSFLTFSACEDDDAFLFDKFPAGFKWGVGSSAYKVEGGVIDEGKGLSIWDVYAQKPGNIYKDQTPDVAADSYNKYDEDVRLIKNLGVRIYKFSISWSRVLPTGSGSVNQQGLDYYKNLIQELKSNNIEPMVVLYDNDLPLELEKHGGWLNLQTINAFITYAQICFSNFGNDVKSWITINEPLQTAVFGYGYGSTPPGVYGPGSNPYTVVHNMIKAHAQVYDLYRRLFSNQTGEIGISVTSHWIQPKYPELEVDKNSQERSLQFMIGAYLDPLLSGSGDYPDVVKQLISGKSTGTSRLPLFTDAELVRNKGSLDFIGVNYYSTLVETHKILNCNPPHVKCDSNSVKTGESSMDGNGLRRLLKWIKRRYNNTKVYITEDGYSDKNKTFDDRNRQEYVKDHLNSVLKAVIKDDCNVKGFIYKALIDGFEGKDGYSTKTGLYQVDFQDSDRKRSPRSSARLFKQLVEDNGFKMGYPGKAGLSTGQVPYEDPLDIYFDKFPDDFDWGVGTAAYAVEGAWNTDGKGPSIWDTATHSPDYTENGDISADQYQHYKEDVQLIKKLGVSTYSFSISWSRILPKGELASYNVKGMTYYKNLVDELKKNNIEPMVTLYYRDMPQVLEDQGGWLNSSTIEYYKIYADKCFEELGSKVKMWLTFNSPQGFIYHGYGDGVQAPHKKDLGNSVYIVAKNVLLAHAHVHKLYQNTYKSQQNGTVGIAPNFLWIEPKTKSQEDVDAADRWMQSFIGMFLEPIYGSGNYPEVLIRQLNTKSRDQGLTASRLIPLSQDEQNLIRGSSDFLGMSFFTTMYGKHHQYDKTLPPNVKQDQDVELSYDLSSLGARNSSEGNMAYRTTPLSLRKMLNWVKYNYNNTPVYITESGYYDNNGSLVDEHRIHYHRLYTNNVLKAIKLDGCDVKGYVVKSLLDGFEWEFGYRTKYGLYSVDFNDTDRKRTARASAHWYSILTKENAFNKGFTQKGGWGVAPQYIDQFYYDKFPDDFVFSSATSSAQIEGAWNEDGKGVGIWDTFSQAGHCKENATANIACDSYHKYKEDVQMLKKLGVKSYRFSISWPRIMSDGTPATTNDKGIEYYNNVIDELLENGIKPVVTIYHWDLPQALQDHGGWLNDSIIEHFRKYSAVLFEKFGDRVDMWITLNEPWVFTVIGYGTGDHAPGFKELGRNPYITAHNAIRAHAEAYHQYHDVYNGTGRIGITLNIDWTEPVDRYNMLDVEAADNSVQTFLGWFAHPIYVNGDYPQVMKDIVSRNSKGQNLPKSRLPEFTAEEKERINGTSDFFGMNSYTSGIARAEDPIEAAKQKPNYFGDRGAIIYADPDWKPSGSSWLHVVPWGIRRILNWVRNNYGVRDILITENGVSDNNSTLDDFSRIYFFTNYINEVLKAVKLDGVQVIGYTAWSLMDNFEWAEGYTEYFGLYSVNFDDPNRPRTPKRSAQLIHQIIQDNGFIKGSKTDPARPNDIPYENKLYAGDFPSMFSWGAGTTAYNVEGGWEAGGKGASTLDTFYHKTPKEANGDVAANSYGNYMDDIMALKEIGASHYFLSISWSRIMPMGSKDNINQPGIDYYNKVLKSLHEHNIKPMVTLFAWDLPDVIETQYGGWLNASTIDLFEEYARVCFKMFGYRVKHWMTFDEPGRSAYFAYELGKLPPGKMENTVEMYRAVHNIIKAHARVYHMYHKEFRRLQKGHVGIKLRREWFLPKDFRNPADNDALWRFFEFEYGWVGDPIIKTGDY
ncbi:hypothetical protein LOTGIDRAFT_231551, partial [Lottia gigantea]